MEEKVFIVDDYGVAKDSGKDAVPAVINALKDAASYNKPCKVAFLNGRYDFYPQHATKRQLNISNTLPEEKCEGIPKTLGICLENMHDVTIDGNGASIVFHGKMTIAAIFQSHAIAIKNLSVDFRHPTVTEMTVVEQGDGYLVCEVHPDSLYRITDGKIQWYGENFSFSKGISQIFDPPSGKTWREYGPMQDEHVQWEPLSANKVKLCFDRDKTDARQNPYHVQVGQVLQMRDPLRDEVGVFLCESSDVALENVSLHFMHGLGIIGQDSHNITIKQVTCAPNPKSGRTCAAFADFVHFSGCKGQIRIEDSRFIGSHDDVINVHGTHLKITRTDVKNITLRFMHRHTYGVGGFHIGDVVEAVDPDTLCAVGGNIVKDVRQISPRELVITLEENAEGIFQPGYFVENVTCTPEVVIKNNYCERVPTRGFLVTTRQKVVISGNTLTGMGMSGLLIADDAKSWYESGCVKDVTVQENRFIKCGQPCIFIEPENTIADKAVHSNIRILNNTFVSTKGDVILSAKSVKGLWFTGNRIEGGSLENTIVINECSDIHIEENNSIS